MSHQDKKSEQIKQPSDSEMVEDLADAFLDLWQENMKAFAHEGLSMMPNLMEASVKEVHEADPSDDMNGNECV